jgi:serine/threonine protein phosphatase PrpC
MEIVTYAYTNKGGRDNNEDYAAFRSAPNGIGVWSLADGLGGHDCGEIASKAAAEYILQATADISEFPEETLIRIMNKANELILTAQKTEMAYHTMRTTVVAAFADARSIQYFNVGDSRFYYFKNGCLYKQSKDHSVSQVAASIGEIPVTQIRFHDDRNKLLKVLGNEEFLKIDRLDDAVPMETGDAFLLCSDGFWEYVYETEMEIDLIKSESPKEWLEYMVNRLLLRVTNNNDNFTALCSFVS